MFGIVEERFAGNNRGIDLKQSWRDVSGYKRDIWMRDIVQTCESALMILGIRQIVAGWYPLKHADIGTAKTFCLVALNPFFKHIKIVVKESGQVILIEFFPGFHCAPYFWLVEFPHFPEMIGFEKIVGIERFASGVLWIEKLKSFGFVLCDNNY